MKRLIPVTKRLPKCDGMKEADLGWLVCNKDSPKKRPFVTFQHPSWWNSAGCDAITHWMDLPEFPK